MLIPNVSRATQLKIFRYSWWLGFVILASTTIVLCVSLLVLIGIFITTTIEQGNTAGVLTRMLDVIFGIAITLAVELYIMRKMHRDSKPN